MSWGQGMACTRPATARCGRARAACDQRAEGPARGRDVGDGPRVTRGSCPSPTPSQSLLASRIVLCLPHNTPHPEAKGSPQFSPGGADYHPTVGVGEDQPAVIPFSGVRLDRKGAPGRGTGEPQPHFPPIFSQLWARRGHRVPAETKCGWAPPPAPPPRPAAHPRVPSFRLGAGTSVPHTRTFSDQTQPLPRVAHVGDGPIRGHRQPARGLARLSFQDK